MLSYSAVSLSDDIGRDLTLGRSSSGARFAAQFPVCESVHSNELIYFYTECKVMMTRPSF